TFYPNEVHNNYEIFIDNVPLQTAFIQQATDVKVFQGKTLHVQFQANKPLKEATAKLFSKKYPCFPESKESLIYEVFIPIACEEKPNEYILAINCVDYVDNEVTLEERVQIIPFPFKKQKITVSAQKMTEEKAVSQSQDELNAKMLELTEQSPKEKLWTGNFAVPTDVTATFTDFGTLRTTPDRGMYAHKGVDVGSVPKAGVWAPQDGIVVVKDRYIFSGNTVVIDHGWGIFSLLFHLEDFAPSIEVGQKIKRGNPVGRVGKTGYANGYHLHWEMRINNIEIDPTQWVKEGF
ncbi:M23 family metallopeptidase, partial [bacterium]|nr:M23 family metallopeptidase [bacterium]